MSKVFSLHTIPSDLLSTVGGKARGLHLMDKAGYSVPEAFIVTQIGADDSLDEALEAYSRMGSPLVSVRSSASVEDGEDYSAAGQFSTFLNVQGADCVRQAIQDCVASLHNETALHYRQNFLQASGTDCQMTVVVQRMVDARCAGVIFTQAPMKAGFTLVEAVTGLGENLVSGKISAQQYRVRDHHVEEMPENAILSEEEAVRLGEQGKLLEQVFGQPMDLEWAIDQEDHIQWLQARPITVGESVTMNELDCTWDVTRSVLTTGNIGEVMPGAVTPLNLSTSMLALDWGVMETYRQIGCIPHEVAPYKYITPFYNHMFFNMSNMYEFGHSAFGTTKETMDLAICGRVLEGYPDLDMPDASPWKKMRNTRVFMHYMLGGEEAKQGMDRWVNTIRFDLDADMHGLYRQILDHFQALKWVNYYHYRTSYYSGGMTNFLMMAVSSRYSSREECQAAIAGCMTGIDHFESADILHRMRHLATLILSEQPDCAAYTAEQLDRYYRLHASEQVREAYTEFMTHHGHRGIREMEIRCASWQMNPISFWQSMRQVLASASHDEPKGGIDWQEHARQLTEGMSTGMSRLTYRLIRNARRGVQYREYTKARVVLALDRYKQAYARLSCLMHKAGLLPDTDAIYFLTQDEVGRVLRGETGLSKKALARRRLFPQQMELRFPDVCLGMPRPIEAQQTDTTATRYTGTPVSRGIVTGPAHIVLSEDDANHLQPGEIMVAACTDVGWTPYYDIIGGLITEIGSALSHGIVVAREYALPSVVNVPNALNNIHNGDIITLDGNTGTIIIKERK